MTFIYGKMEEYIKIKSLTGREQKFMAYLIKDFSTLKDYIVSPRVDCFEVRNKRESPITILTHIDRVPVKPFQYKFSETIQGQLDNVISISIIRYLCEQRISLDVLFTTKEESCSNAYQIIDFHKEYPEQILVDLDIDIGIKEEEVWSGVVSLRKRDSNHEYTPSVVSYLEKLCKENNINYINKDGWLVCQIGLALQSYDVITNKSVNNVSDIKGGYIGLPILEYHSNQEIASIKCIENTVKLLTILGKN